MGFFGDIKIIFKSLFTIKENSNSKEIREEEKSNSIIGFIKSKILNDSNKFTYYSSKPNIFKLNDTIKSYNEFSLFAFVKNKDLLLIDQIKVDVYHSLNPYICLNYKSGYDKIVYKRDNYIEVSESYDKYGKFIGNDENNKSQIFYYNSIPYVSYKISRDKEADVIVEFKNGTIFKVGTILRRHKTSGHGYNHKCNEHLETIANLMYFNPVSIKMISKYKGEIEYPISCEFLYKIAFDIINKKLLFISSNREIIKAYVIESVIYKLNKEDDSTQKVVLNLDNGDIIELYAPDNCFLHNKNF